MPTWQDHVDQQLIRTGKITVGIIGDPDGNIWAQRSVAEPGEITAEFTPQIVKEFVTQWKSPDSLYVTHVRIGQKFKCLESTAQQVKASKGQMFFYALRIKSAVILGLSVLPEQTPEECMRVIDNMGKYLSAAGY
eukprot:GFYU01011517.1.p1 GENE.GFYU01011517.1~~GFYU01011517.1.p1  ORF type:complete len:135 (+),score=27.25 GFYU01011517.1:70-474(+)